MRKVLFILFLCTCTLLGQKIDLINQTKSSCTAGYVFYGGTSGRVACDGGITWDTSNKRLTLVSAGAAEVRLTSAGGSARSFSYLTDGSSVYIKNVTDNNGDFVLRNSSNVNIMSVGFASAVNTIVTSATGVGIGKVPTTKLDVNGTATATAFSGPLTGAVTGNASTATALAANPTDCGAGAWAISIDASGNLTCTTPTLDQIGNLAANKTFNNAANSISFNFTNPTNQPTYDGAFEIQASGAFAGDLLHVHQHTGNPGTSHLAHFEASDADVIPLHITGPTNDGSTLLADLADSDGATVFSVDSNGNIIAPTLSGNASTSTALAADPTDCAAGQFANAIAANGNLTCAVASAGYRASLTNSAVQSLNNDAATALTFDTEVEDVGGMHDSGTNPSRITIPAGGDGVYLLVCSVGYAAHATGFRQATMYLGGATVLTNNTYEAVSTAGKITVVQSSTYKSLVATNYVECYGQQNSGGALNTNNSAWNTFFQVVKLN